MVVPKEANWGKKMECEMAVMWASQRAVERVGGSVAKWALNSVVLWERWKGKQLADRLDDRLECMKVAKLAAYSAVE